VSVVLIDIAILIDARRTSAALLALSALVGAVGMFTRWP
jgi:hypothetical protein